MPAIARARLVWRGPQVTAEFIEQGKRGLENAAQMIVDRVKEITSLPAPPRSEPGEPPRTRTGALPRSIIKESSKDRSVWQIGHNRGFWEIGARLEFGTRRMAARPHLRPAFDEIVKRLPKLVADG